MADKKRQNDFEWVYWIRKVFMKTQQKSKSLRPFGKRFFEAWKKRDNFKIEIALVLLAKAFLLYLIWFFFFSHGLQDHLNDRLMLQHLVGS
jgi:hypothetical protein